MELDLEPNYFSVLGISIVQFCVLHLVTGATQNSIGKLYNGANQRLPEPHGMGAFSGQSYLLYNSSNCFGGAKATE